MPFTYYVATKDAKVYQINNVEKITIGSPMVANGTYRDQNAVVVGGGAGALGADASASVAGGVQPQVTLDSVLGTAQATGDSSILQDDTFNHIAPRFLYAPIGYVFFTTSAGIATAPTNTSFTITPPPTDFYVYDVDCFFLLEEVVGVFNAPPPGFSPTKSIVTSNNAS
jgi:hypothetical protein